MGSTPPLGYSYIQLFGQVSEADYPYVSGTTTNDEDCQYDLASVSPVASITGYNNLPPNDQDAIMAHLANVGPLAISVAASNFKDYHGGVFSGCPYDQNIQLNHAVQLVGYGSDFSPAGVVDYWLVRNSWGESWGENGYIRILREANPVRNGHSNFWTCLPERSWLFRPPPRVRHVRNALRDLLPSRSSSPLNIGFGFGIA